MFILMFAAIYITLLLRMKKVNKTVNIAILKHYFETFGIERQVSTNFNLTKFIV